MKVYWLLVANQLDAQKKDLSSTSLWESGKQDLNLRPLRPERSALPSWATSRKLFYYGYKKKRKTGFEPATPTMARWCSTTELLPHFLLIFLYPVGKTGFEPATPWSQTRCSTKLSYFPLYAPSRSRTYNLLIRSQTLYPVALWVHFSLWCRGPESNRYGSHLPRDFKSRASASSATPA